MYLFVTALGLHCSRGLSLVAEWGLLSSYAQTSHCSGFSCGAGALGYTGFSSCGSRA